MNISPKLCNRLLGRRDVRRGRLSEAQETYATDLSCRLGSSSERRAQGAKGEDHH